MSTIADHLAKAARKMPAVIGATLDRGNSEIEALGTIAEAPDPEALAWEIGSITKVFTGVLLAEMSVRGEVSLDDPIGTYVPGAVAERLPDPARQPTLADLSAHTAGLPRVPRAWLKEMKGHPDPYSEITQQDVWNALGSQTIRLPKPRPRYSNFGVGLLGLLLGRATNSTYEALVTERILGPLHMTSTGFGATPVQGFRKGEPTPPWTFQSLAAAGGLRSTISDMLVFARACIYPPEGTLGAAIRLSRAPVYEGRVNSVGLGWQIRKRPGRPVDALWHNGGTFGGSAFLATHPTREIAVVSFGNVGPRLLSPLDGPSWKLYDHLVKAGA
jgi:CubicO group peptidase (beta-lactamase class C family)